MWRNSLWIVCFVALATLAWPEEINKVKEEPSDATADYIHVEARGVLRHGTSATTITANGITWQLQLPRWKKVYTDPKFLELAKALDGQRAIVNGMLRRETDAGNREKVRWILEVVELKPVPRTVSLTLVANDQGRLAAIYFGGKKYDEVAEVEEALGHLKRVDDIVLNCDSRLQHQYIVSVLSIAQKKTTQVKIRKLSAGPQKTEDKEKQDP